LVYGPQPKAAVDRVHRGLCRAALCLEGGDLGRASLEAVMLGLPELAPDALAKLADFEKGANTAWQNQPRVPAGQHDGGQWTTGGGGAVGTSNVASEASHERPAPTPPMPRSHGTIAPTTTCSDAVTVNPEDKGLLIPVSTAGVAVGGSRIPLPQDLTLPPAVARLSRAGLLAFAAGLLDQWDAAVGRQQIANAMQRFGLDPTRPADVIAASAYVWSQYQLPSAIYDVPFSGKKLDAASQAVMRFALANPGTFVAWFQGTPTQRDQASALIIEAANRGLVDYASESRARPQGVAPELQTTSESARAAIASQLQNGRFQAHHLVPAMNWGEEKEIAQLAYQAGWRVDAPSNLIGLPADAKAQAEAPEWLPIHIGPHAEYCEATQELIAAVRQRFPPNLTPLEARAILDDVASINAWRIRTGAYGRILKSAS
jgi:HNH/ENDO VII superfamily nuclease